MAQDNTLRKMIQWVRWHAGRRGAFLAFLTVLDIAYGWALLTMSVAPLKHSPDFFLPLHVWGFIWIGTGLFCLSGIFLRFDRIHYTAAAMLKAAWGLLYLDLQLEGTAHQAWVSVTVWIAFAFIVMLVAGWPEEGKITDNKAPKLPAV